MKVTCSLTVGDEDTGHIIEASVEHDEFLTADAIDTIFTRATAAILRLSRELQPADGD